ncbi:MAG: hypothetical protein J6O41_06465, partial [Clostridia bacterium]|nr:hypothetical protein [Clostridia bacterium]
MKKEKIKNILLIVIVALVTSFVTAYGVSSTFDSSNVCYQVDSSTGASVQDTIDDLYGRASDYSTLNNKLDGYFQYDPTSYFIGSDLRLGANSTSDVGPGLILYKNSNTRGSRFVYNASTGVTSIDAYNSSGIAGQGTLNLAGNPVTINGSLPMVMLTGFSSSDGRYYTRKINNIHDDRFSFIIMRTSQSGGLEPVFASVNKRNGVLYAIHFSSTT